MVSPMNTPAYTIVSISEGTTVNAQRQAVYTKLIKYMVGTDGPFTYTVPPGMDTPAQIAAALTTAAANIAAIRGGM
jgi:hypothetical protein